MKLICIVCLACSVLCSCGRSSGDPNSSQQSDIKFDNPINQSITVKQETPVVKEYVRRMDMDTLVRDTLTSINFKFRQIFERSLFSHPQIGVEFIHDSTFRDLELKFLDSSRNVVIGDYESFRDSLLAGNYNLDASSFTFTDGDTLESFHFIFRDGSDMTIEWDPGDWGSYGFIGYIVNSGYYWLQEFDHGSNDVLVNAGDGEIIHFVPLFSPGKKYYCQIKSDYAYADMQFLNVIIGSNTSDPFFKIYDEYYPFGEGVDYWGEFIIDRVFWQNDESVLFRFQHKITRNDDILYFEETGVRLTIQGDQLNR